MKKISLLFLMNIVFMTAKAAYPQVLPIDYSQFFSTNAIGTNPNLEKGIYATTSATLMQNQWNRSGKLTSGEGAGISPQIENSNLVYLNFINNNLGKAIILDPNIAADPLVSGSTFRTTVYSLTSSSTDYVGTFYAGMLINFTTAPVSGVDFFAFDSNYTGNAQRGRIFIKASTNPGYYNIGIGFSGVGDIATWSTDIAIGSTNYIVAKITVASTGNESIALYLNPNLNSLESNSTPVNSGSYTAALKSIKGLVIRQRPGIGGKIAGLRFSNIWSDVVAVQSTATQLNSPVLGTTTNITSTGFTANWAPVSNAVSYNVKVYIGTNPVKTTSVSSGTSANITGLMSGTDYKYTVTAIGDVVNYSDSPESTASSTITTSGRQNSISTDFNDNTWGTVSVDAFVTGSFPSGSINGFDLAAAGLYAGGTKGLRGESHTNRISVDKLSEGGKVTFPTVNSLEQIEIHLTFGSGDKDFLLKEFNPSTNSWTLIGDYTYNMASKNAGIDSIYIIPISRNVPSKFRIENNTSSGLFIYQIITRITNPALLAKTQVQAASAISASEFIANWSTVENAGSYKVLVYQGSTLKGTYDASGQSTKSKVISGLTPNTAYTYKVQAISNNVDAFSDSFLSVASAVTTTNTFIISDTKSISALSSLNASNSVEVSNGGTLNIDAANTISTITVNPGAKMNVTALNPLTVSTLTLKSDKDDNSFSIKLDAGITATNARLFKTIDDTKWYFMSFPCDVNVSSITKSNGDPMGTLGTDWFIKYYDGNKRANDGVSNGSNWVSVTGGTLTAQQGYIFGLKTGTPETELLIPLTTEILNAESSEKSIPVMSHNSGLAAEVHKGWNLIGQPYLSRFAAQTGSDVPFMVVPNADGKTYSVKSKAIGTLPEINPMTAYFVQTGSDGNLSFGLTSRQSVRSLVEKNAIDYLQLKISNNSGVDDTYLILDDNQSTAYQIGQDMEKWLGTGSDKPQIYSTLNDVKYAFNALPANSVNNLKIGTYTKVSGSATISVDASQTSGISKLMLTDNSNGFVTDLLASDYHFTAGEGIDESRFTLTIQKISTETKAGFETNEPFVTLNNGRIVINNIKDLKSVQVYDAAGHLLTTINAGQDTIELPGFVKGIYTIKIQTTKETLTKKMII